MNSKSITEQFNKQSYTVKWKIVVLVILFLFSIVDWIVHPPFFKDQYITIIEIEKRQQRSYSPDPTYYKRFHYVYYTSNGEMIKDSFDLYDYPRPKLHETIVKNVRTPFGDGGELRVLSGVFVVFLVVMSLFLIHYIVFVLFKLVGVKDITQKDVTALLSGLFIMLLLMYQILG